MGSFKGSICSISSIGLVPSKINILNILNLLNKTTPFLLFTFEFLLFSSFTQKKSLFNFLVQASSLTFAPELDT